MPSEIRTVRVQSDGTPKDTVVTLNDGKNLDMIRSATVWLEANEAPRVDLEIWMPVVDVHANIDTFTFACPCCGKSISHGCNDDD